MKYLFADELFIITLTKVSLKLVTLIYPVVSATKNVKNDQSHVKKTISKPIVTSEPMSILNVSWQLIQVLMSLKWIL